jgi:hypothetical protein
MLRAFLAGVSLVAAVPLWAEAVPRKPHAPAAKSGAVTTDPLREAYFGDLHLHTYNSFDAFMLVGTKTTPDEAFRFAHGEPISYERCRSISSR